MSWGPSLLSCPCDERRHWAAHSLTLTVAFLIFACSPSLAAPVTTSEASRLEDECFLHRHSMLEIPEWSLAEPLCELCL